MHPNHGAPLFVTFLPLVPETGKPLKMNLYILYYINLVYSYIRIRSVLGFAELGFRRIQGPADKVIKQLKNKFLSVVVYDYYYYYDDDYYYYYDDDYYYYY